MKTFITALLCFALAGATLAQDASDAWGSWDELPENVLNLGDATTAEELSRQLDKLIQQNPDSPEIDRLLDLWLEQTAGRGRGPALPLHVLMKLDNGKGRGRQGLSELPLAGEDRHRELLEQILENRPFGNGQGPPGTGPAGGQGAGGSGNSSGSGQGPNSGNGSVNEDAAGSDF